MNVQPFRKFGTGNISFRWYTIQQMLPIPLFQDLDEESLAMLSPLFERYTCAPGVQILRQNDAAVHLYLLLRGRVSICYKPYDGPPITLTRLHEGDVFGWSAAIGSPFYTSGVVADEEVEAVRIRGRDLQQFCREHPEMGRVVLERLASVVSRRWKNAREQVASMLDKQMAKANGHSKKETAKMNASKDPNQERQLRGLIEQLSAYVEQFHEGSVEFVAFDGKTLTVKLGGACLGCPLSPTTLHGWVAGTVHQFFPDVEVAEAE